MKNNNLRSFAISLLLMLSLVAGGWQSADAVTETGTCTHPDIKVVQAEPATCQKTGMKKHWKCESCGLGENACKGMKDEDTIYKVKFTPAASAPDVSKYKIPEL